jgi:hypothetical protein
MEPGDTYSTYPPHDQRPSEQRPKPPRQRVHVQPLVLTREDLGLDDDDGRDDHGRGKVSSKRSRRWQHVDANIAKAFNRVARAAEHGTSEYIDSRDRSEDDRKDGAILDLYENVARGVSKAVSEASPALVDIARAYNTRQTRRSLRNVLDRLPRLPVIG